MAASSVKVADPAPLPRPQRPARLPQNKHFKKQQRRVCARCGDTIEASRCAARAGVRANNTAHADVRVNGAARARAALAPTKPLATALAPRRRSRSSFATAPDRVAGGGDGRGGGGWRHARLSARAWCDRASVNLEWWQGAHPGWLRLRRPGAYRWPQHAAIFVVVAIAARSKIGCERTGTRATSGSSSSLHITESRSRHSRSRRRPRERSHRCGGGGGERRRTIASLAAAGGGMHGYLQGRDAIEQASVSVSNVWGWGQRYVPGAYRWPGTLHGWRPNRRAQAAPTCTASDGARVLERC